MGVVSYPCWSRALSAPSVQMVKYTLSGLGFCSDSEPFSPFSRLNYTASCTAIQDPFSIHSGHLQLYASSLCCTESNIIKCGAYANIEGFWMVWANICPGCTSATHKIVKPWFASSHPDRLLPAVHHSSAITLDSILRVFSQCKRNRKRGDTHSTPSTPERQNTCMIETNITRDNGELGLALKACRKSQLMTHNPNPTRRAGSYA